MTSYLKYSSRLIWNLRVSRRQHHPSATVNIFGLRKPTNKSYLFAEQNPWRFIPLLPRNKSLSNDERRRMHLPRLNNRVSLPPIGTGAGRAGKKVQNMHSYNFVSIHNPTYHATHNHNKHNSRVLTDAQHFYGHATTDRQCLATSEFACASNER